MKYLFYLVLICGWFGCEAMAFSVKPKHEVSETPEPVATPTPTPTAIPEALDIGKNRAALFDIITKSSCPKFEYGGNQGKAASGYLRGLVLTYVKTICSKDSDVYKIGSQPLGDSSKDALAHYGLKPKTAEERLNTTFALMIGSNARESSWRPCVGRDVKAKKSDVQGCLYGSGSTCEAGLSQTSYNSISDSAPLRDLFNKFQKDQSTCFRAEYYGSTKCSEANWKNHGSDPLAVAYQKTSKECPAFSVESAAIMFRTKRTHYGPINFKYAEVVPSCISMFESVRQTVETNPSLCGIY